MKSDLIEIRKKLSKILFKFSEVVDENGLIVIYDGELIEGSEVYTYDSEGAKVKLPDGSYSLKIDEKKVSIETVDGIVKVLTIEEASVETPTESHPDEMSNELNEKLTNLESKVIELSNALNKMNDVLISLGNQAAPAEPKKKIEIKDSKISASKYFTK